MIATVSVDQYCNKNQLSVSHLFSQAVAVFQYIIYPVSFLSLLGHLGVLPSESEVGQDVDHDLGKAISQQLLPVLSQVITNGFHFVKIIQEDQVWDQHMVR